MVDPAGGLASLLREAAMYETETRGSVRLVPTEGVMSPLQKLMYLTMQHERYLHAPPEDSDKAIRYPDIGRLQAVYAHCSDMLRRLLKANYVIPDPLSGLQSMLIAILALSDAGDAIWSISPRHGGHEALRPMLALVGRRSRYLRFDECRHTINSQQHSGLPPKVVYVDHSNNLHPHDVAQLRQTFPSSTIVVDISQVMLLVAGGVYPNPLAHGADVITGSTHKSLCGPQKGITATNSPVHHDRLSGVVRTLVSNNHPASVAALAVCLQETARFGAEFALKMVRNANALADGLAEFGVPVYRAVGARDVTSTQHVWVDCAKLGRDAEHACRALADLKIVTNTLFLPRGGHHGRGARGLRLGTTELTRVGMQARDMHLVADWIATVLHRRDTSQIAERALGLRARFPAPRYCVDPLDVAGAADLLRECALLS